MAGQWAATLYSAVLSTLLSFALGRFLGPESFGTYSYILTAASIFAIFQDGGFSTLIFREAAHPSPGLAPKAPLERLALGHTALVTTAGLAAIWLLPLTDKAAFSLALVYYALFSAGVFLSADLKGHGQFEREARLRMALRTCTVLAVGIALAMPGAGAALLFGGWVLGQAAGLTLPMASGIRKAPSFRLDLGIYKSCGAFLLISAATTIYFKSDIILLTRLTGDNAAVGQYAAAYRLIEAAVLFAAPLAQIFFRKLRVSMHAPEVFKRAFRTQMLVMCALAVAGTAFSMWIGPLVIRLAFGGKYGPAEELCLWLLPSLLFILPNGILTQALIALGREGFYARVTIATAVCNVALNCALIPFMGAKGSALATVATEALLAAGLGVGYVRRP
nr:oligosaccharide flippase family protein [Fundidesulfovibrio terrae]